MSRNTYQKHGCRCEACRDCDRAYTRRWKALHPELVAGQQERRRPLETARRAAARATRARDALLTRVEQAIATGSPTSRIMRDLGVSYEMVQEARNSLEKASVEVAA